MQQLLLQGKAASSFNGSWLLPLLQAGSPTGPFDLHVAPPPLVDGASTTRPILAWTGVALPAEAAASRDSVHAFLEYASRPEVDGPSSRACSPTRRSPASNVAIDDAGGPGVPADVR